MYVDCGRMDAFSTEMDDSMKKTIRLFRLSLSTLFFFSFYFFLSLSFPTG